MSNDSLNTANAQVPDHIEGPPVSLPLPAEVAAAFPPGNYRCEVDGMSVRDPDSGREFPSLRFWSMVLPEGEGEFRSLHFQIPLHTPEQRQVMVPILDRIATADDYFHGELARHLGPGLGWAETLDQLPLVNTALDSMAAFTFDARIEENPPRLLLDRAHRGERSTPHRTFYPG
jgi:hypothetical protein